MNEIKEKALELLERNLERECLTGLDVPPGWKSFLLEIGKDRFGLLVSENRFVDGVDRVDFVNGG